jgi:hypothetical protein
MKYTSDHTTMELIEMGYIEKFIKPLVIVLTNLQIKTNGSCDGHKNSICQYPWVDFCINDFHKVIGLIENYEDRPEILFQIRNDKNIINKDCKYVRMFPYCNSLLDGRKKFKKLEKFLVKL